MTYSGIAIGDLDGNGHDEVIIDFGVYSLYSWEDLSGYKHLHSFNPHSIVTGRF